MTRLSLEIRHQIYALPDGTFRVVESFGEQTPQSWGVPTREAADALMAERRAMLKEMVASISAMAKRAVDDAREFDNLNAGRA